MMRTPGEMVVIFLAAACLGTAYNAMSPLGVRFSTGTAPAAFAPAPAQAAEVERDPALQNETLTAAILTGGPAMGPASGAQKLTVSMAWAEVKPLLARGEIVLVDGRDDAAFEAGHIPGAVSLPLRSLSEKAAEFSTKYAQAKPLVTYCGSVGCPIAHVLAEQLRNDYGYTDVREMPGGYVEWRTAEAKEERR